MPLFRRASLALFAIALLRGQDDPLATKSRIAKDALVGGRYTEAAKLYRELAAALPDNPGPRLNLGMALEKSGRPAEAVPELARVVRVKPDFAPAWFLLGLAYQQLGQPRKAIEPLSKAAHLEPANLQARVELGDAQLGAGEPREAIATFRELTEGHPEMAKAWHGLGLSYAALGQLASEKLDQIAPRSAYWLALTARERAGLGQPASALALYADAIRESPDLPGLHAARSEIYSQTNHPDWAAIESKRESQIPKPDCSRRAALCAYLAGDWTAVLSEAHNAPTPETLYLAALTCGKLATQSFERLATLPESAEIHELLAESNQRTGRRVEAVEEWRKALSLEPGDQRVQGRLAASLIRDRKYDEAEHLLEPLVAAQPENAEWQYLLGEALFEQRRADAALPHLVAARRLTPDGLENLEVLGRVYLELGKPKEAVPCLEKARPLDDGSVSFALSTAYRRLGREEDARVALARYRQLTQNKSTTPALPADDAIPPP